MRLAGDLDWRVFAASAVVCVGSTLLFGLVPALLTSKVDLAQALRSESSGAVGARGTGVRSTLVRVLDIAQLCAAGGRRPARSEHARGANSPRPAFSRTAASDDLG